MTQLAREAGVSYRTVFKAEVEPDARLRHRTLENIAKPLGLHPDRLFVRANLTPYLRTTSLGSEPSADARRARTFEVTGDEYEKLESYLRFLRFADITGHVGPPSTEMSGSGKN